MARAGARPPLHRDASGTLPNTKVPYATPAAEEAAREAAVVAQLSIWRQQLPDLFRAITQVRDPRRPGSVRHSVTVVLFYGLLLFLFQYASHFLWIGPL